MTTSPGAIQLDPGDKTLHGKIRLVDGHLARLRGTAEKDPLLLENARQDFLAASLAMKKSPDPWLGLAPLYIYSLHDLTHGEAAIRQANRLGMRPASVKQRNWQISTATELSA